MSAATGKGNSIALDVDVLVLGGGPAGAWAALSAARRGATVVLADKGYCGTSGAAAASNNNVWYVADSNDYERHFAERHASGGGLNERAWTDALLANVVGRLHLLGDLGYPFARKGDGTANYATLRGPDYMRFMRQQIRRAGVTVLDHSPVLGLVRHDGRVTGGYGIRRDGSTWRVGAGATVIATGGCAFLGGALGTDVCTGDGHLAAAEAGATFSGMEFSSQYGLAAAFSSVTKGLPFMWASYSRENGSEIPVVDDEAFVSVARVLIDEPVFATFDRANVDVQRWLRSGQANAFLPFDRMGIDPFRQRFPVGLRLEGTVRGTGGIRLAHTDCSTDVPGLYAAGDAASREVIVGGRSGGGSPNAAWAIATGAWAGEAASGFASRQRRVASSRGVDAAGWPAYEELAIADPATAREALRSDVLPPQVNLFRNEARLVQATKTLDAALTQPVAADTKLAAARSARALVYVAKLAYRSALERRESRALHRRSDYPQRDDAAGYRQVIGGIDTLTIARETVNA
ncbi:FAD-dependent oxidoreductase [Paraburkholderia saeva]|uniref:FAD-dependent oxidoreductase n=1 Tax=Paraburkholderia saeva TaxID=2777537 RepID=UPI001E1146B3|nr:FAD-binding protein [Paraburkholderia saeva]CAG4900657.1 L-aspartate oxidase [Paraburkholderia saeva]